MTLSSLSGNAPLDASLDLLIKVADCFRLSAMHHVDDVALKKPMIDMENIVNQFFDQDVSEVRIQCAKGCFFVNGQIINIDNEQAQSTQMMRRMMRRLSVHEIAFRDRLDYENMTAFMGAFQDRIWHENVPDHPELHPKIALRSLNRTQRERLFRRGDRRSEVIKNYVILALSVRNASSRFHEKRPISVAEMRRAIQLIYESFDGYENMLIGLTRFTNPDGRSYFHAAGVAVLVMLMAKNLNLSGQIVSELAIGSMLYDVARDTLTDPFQGGKINAQTVSQTVHHVNHIPLRSLIRLSIGKPPAAGLHRASMAYEVTQNLEEGGIGPSLAARIIAVASAYQLMTAPIPPRRGITPDRALGIIFANPQRYDRKIGELLALSIGHVPIGTLVRLSNGMLGVVYERPQNPKYPKRPSIRVITENSTQESSAEENAIIDLATQMDISIEAVLDPIEENINIPRVLIGNLSKEEIRDPPETNLTTFVLEQLEAKKEDAPQNSEPRAPSAAESSFTEAKETIALSTDENSLDPSAIMYDDVTIDTVEYPIGNLEISEIAAELNQVPIETISVSNESSAQAHSKEPDTLLSIDTAKLRELDPQAAPPLKLDTLSNVEEIEATDLGVTEEKHKSISNHANTTAVPAASYEVIEWLFGESQESPVPPIKALDNIQETGGNSLSPSSPLEPDINLIFESPTKMPQIKSTDHTHDTHTEPLQTLPSNAIEPLFAHEPKPRLKADGALETVPLIELPSIESNVNQVSELTIDDLVVAPPSNSQINDLPIQATEPPPLSEGEDIGDTPPPPTPVQPIPKSWDEMPQLSTTPSPEPPPVEASELEPPGSPEDALFIDSD